METRLHLEIAGTGIYLPEKVIPNSYFLHRPLKKYNVDGSVKEIKVLEDENEIVNLTGIYERRRANPDEIPSSMGYKAARNALENSGVKADSLVGIIGCTVTEDVNFPSAACKIQRDLGVRGCFAYDIANACAALPEALAQANARVLTRPGNYLVVAAECLSKMVDDEDLNSTLFGDGAAAVVLRPTESKCGILKDYSVSDPHEGKDTFIFRDSKRILRMPYGKRVMKIAVNKMLKSIEYLKEQLNWDCADVIIPHQANIRIIDGVAERADKKTIIFKNVAKYGNMSSVTCGVGMHEALETGLIKRNSPERAGSRVIVTSFGGGLVTAAVAIQF